MAVLVCDPNVEDRIRAEREANGLDLWDEVWEGIYVMAPIPNDQHQELATRLATILQAVLGWSEEAKVRAGTNVSDREAGWEHNYRCPDVAVFMKNTRAKNCETHWMGGPDFTVEIVSPKDRSRQKLEFYASLGVRELLIIDRYPWSIELYRLDGGKLADADKSTMSDSEVLVSQVVPLSFRLVAGGVRPNIEVTHRDGVQKWLV